MFPPPFLPGFVRGLEEKSASTLLLGKTEPYVPPAETLTFLRRAKLSGVRTAEAFMHYNKASMKPLQAFSVRISEGEAHRSVGVPRFDAERAYCSLASLLPGVPRNKIKTSWLAT